MIIGTYAVNRIVTRVSESDVTITVLNTCDHDLWGRTDCSTSIQFENVTEISECRALGSEMAPLTDLNTN